MAPITLFLWTMVSVHIMYLEHTFSCGLTVNRIMHWIPLLYVLSLIGIHLLLHALDVPDQKKTYSSSGPFLLTPSWREDKCTGSFCCCPWSSHYKVCSSIQIVQIMTALHVVTLIFKQVRVMYQCHSCHLVPSQASKNLRWSDVHFLLWT
jgi:hypothetical protein